MIQIEDNDLPITVAHKLITATQFTPDTVSPMLAPDMFSDDELIEIATHLLVNTGKLKIPQKLEDEE